MHDLGYITGLQVTGEC